MEKRQLARAFESKIGYDPIHSVLSVVRLMYAISFSLISNKSIVSPARITLVIEIQAKGCVNGTFAGRKSRDKRENTE